MSEIRDCSTCDYGHFNDHWGMPFCYSDEECKDWNKWKPKKQEEDKINFEDCKKIMRQYLEAKQAMKKLMEKCKNCKEKTCHCNDECPMFINGQCRWDL